MSANASVDFSSDAPPIAILGVPFENINTDQTIQLVDQMIQSRGPHYLATANVDFLVQALRDAELRRILWDAHLVLCDGMPLIWASRLLGNPLPERVAGSDLVPLLIRLASEKGYRIFFLGSTPEATTQAVHSLLGQYPNLQIAGSYSPSVSPLLDMNHTEMIQQVRDAKPDLLFVAFGCPKQEKWIAMHYRNLGVPVAIGVGATIDFLAGRFKRAPVWMRRTGTEWIYRLMQEPRRLFHRYVKDLWVFGWGIFFQWWRLQFCLRRQRGRGESVSAASGTGWFQIKLPERLDMEAVQRNQPTWEQVFTSQRSCLLDAVNVRFIDSSGVGHLIRIHKRLRQAGHHLILIGPGTAVRRALKLMHLNDFFLVAEDVPGAVQLLQDQPPPDELVLVRPEESGSMRMYWHGEITAANADRVWEVAMGYIDSLARTQNHLVIDLAMLRFIDSTGLGLMIRAKKHAQPKEMTIHFAHPQANVLNVLQIARLEPFLLDQ
jgi:N-acetylglucosaminyldiphosphoundecaprenol N-acetyl-beta-D-mannosaminyltransferase